MSGIQDRLQDSAQDKDRYDEMVKFFLDAGSKEDLRQRCVMYIMSDPLIYPRRDIAAAMKSVEMSKGYG